MEVPLHRRLVSLACLIGIALPALIAPAHGQEASPVVSAEETKEHPPQEDAANEARESLSIESIQSRIAGLEADKELPDEIRAEALGIWRNALGSAQAIPEFAERAERFAANRKRAPEDVRLLKDQLANPLPDFASEVTPQTTIADLEHMLAAAEQELSEAQKRYEGAGGRPKRRAERRTELTALLANAKEQLAGLQQSLPEKPPEVLTAMREHRRIRFRALQQEIASYEQELLCYEAQAELLPLQKDQATRQSAHASRKVKFLQDELLQRRRREAERQAREARRAAADAHPALETLAKENSRLAEMFTGSDGILHKIEQASRYLEELNAELAAVESSFNNVQDKVKAAGLTNMIGLRLRRQRAELPDVDVNRRRIRERRDETNAAALESLDIEDQRAALSDIGTRAQEIFDSLEPAPFPEEMDIVEAKIHELLESQRDYLQSLIDNYARYTDLLAELDKSEWQLIEKTNEYHRFIDENVLWIRSAAPLNASDLSDAYAALSTLVSADNWESAVQTARSNEFLPLWGLALVPLVLLIPLALRKRIRRRLSAIGAQASKGTADEFSPTLKTLALTALLALPAPGLIWYAGWILTTSTEVAEIPRAIGIAFKAVAWVYFVTELIRHCCRPNGLGASHFGWPAGPLKELRRRIRWLLIAGLPAVFFIVVTECQNVEGYKASLGRLALIAGLGAVAVLMTGSLRPGGPIMGPILSLKPDGPWRKASRIWHPLLILVPAALIVAAAMGYHYTALKIAWRIKETLLLATALFLLNALSLRWLLIARRKLALRRWRERRATQMAAQGDPTQQAAVSDSPDMDLATVHEQTHTLLTTGLAVTLLVGMWMVWADVAPALGVLNRVELWSEDPTPIAVEPLSLNAAPETSAGDAQPVVAAPAANETGAKRTVTLVDLLIAVAILLISLLASKNLPGFLEIAVLQRLPIDNGARYAISTISRYVFTVVGVVAASGQLGVGWNKVQWLLAAMSVGLGFGLQEIFANFVSGLIILFERPIRVGDIVTIDQVTGVVSRIRMRATTITNWERKEFVVPNKEFITGRLLNWTLSDQVNRVEVNVGVAHGSDTQLIRRVLLEIAGSNPLIMTDPEPIATFDAFREHHYNFTLRCYLPSLENRLEIINYLHMEIERRFRDEGVQIALPQRDIHIRTIDQHLSVAQLKPAQAADPQPDSQAA